MDPFEQLWDFCATMDAITLPSQRDSPMSAQATGLIVQAKSKPDSERHFLPVFKGLDFWGTGANYFHPSKMNLLFQDVAS